ncbi:NUDIX hydrolase [[Micrococcus luteus] ATCC 49442]|uniref:NUDIX hydrolase n=1 Tax=[Micrococcus luteus] ATCC 49442 TaxID=2698727 RepID=UPI001AD758F8|nr:NUDIX hydrolase [[Micrococcus luteus] ATCC 49442]
MSVHVMPGEGLYSFPGTPDTVAPKGWPECAMPTPWHESGFYGLHGGAGVMFSTIVDGQRRFLLVKRTTKNALWPGQWQLPGGALEIGETPLEAAQRETMEELAIPALGGGTVLGEVVYTHESGWTYTNYAVCLKDAPEHRVDGLEIAHAAWYTPEEVLSISETASMVPELAANIPRILALFPPI